MTPVQFVTTISDASREMHAALSRRLTVGDVARYLSGVEPRADTRTFEIAHPLSPQQPIGELNLLGGDRLIAFTQPPKPTDMPAPVRPGDKLLTLRAGGFEAASQGKRALLVGKPDDAQGVIPDVDMRFVVPADALKHLSPSVLWLAYEQHTWHAVRTGDNRVWLDEYEIGAEPVPLNDGQRLRIISAEGALAELTVAITAAQVTIGEEIEPGQAHLTIRLGVERDPQTLRASSSLPLAAVYDALLRRDLFSVYHMRLIAPGTRLAALDLHDSEFLYTPLQTQFTQNTLVLRSTDNIEQAFELTAGDTDVEKRLGVRLQPYALVSGLDVDLYHLFVANGHAPHTHGLRSPHLLRLMYHATEGMWWVRPAERTQLPVYLNTARLGTQAVPLTEGDLLTFGPSTTDYYARLSVEIIIT